MRHVYEIINPSDAMTITAERNEVAMAAVLLLGEGKLGIKRDDGDCPSCMLLFAKKEETLAFLREHFGTEDLGSWCEAHAADLARCLRSLMYCTVGTRAGLEAAFGDLDDAERDRRLALFNDERRTSLNDYAKYAARLAEHFEKVARTEPGAGHG